MNRNLFNGLFEGKQVLVSGHTGFKGSWLSIWLHELGANVVGVSLDSYSEKGNFLLSGIGRKIKADLRADIRNRQEIKQIFADYHPEIVFHLAAQPLVRLSYDIPAETYETNVMGTINVMEAARMTDSVKVVVMVTSDKCYENREQPRGYHEDEPMGGYDPYSSSKGAAEIAINSWRRSFFNPANYGKTHHIAISSARAGNVIGGGDWAKDRIVPDCIRALECGKSIMIRAPKAVRPWQHVLEPLYGYLLLASKMLQDPINYCEGWNFGPEQEEVRTVWDVAESIVKSFGSFGSSDLRDVSDQNAPHEANLLMLNIDKAKSRLGWCPRLNASQAIELTCDWYKRYAREDVYNLCVEEINSFVKFDI